MGKTERKEGKTKKRKKDGRKISHKEDIEREKELGKKKEEREIRFSFFSINSYCFMVNIVIWKRTCC